LGKFSAFLKESDLFYNLNASQLELVEEICEECSFYAGDFIVRESSRGNEMYLIVQGQVEILMDPELVSPGETGKPQARPEVISRLYPGQSFGEMALVDEGVRSASIRANVDTHVLRISREKFLRLCTAYPELGYRVMFNLALDLSQKIRNAGLHIRQALLCNAGGRTEKQKQV
jgi:CRP/FNR family transcriptional regulator, cyclic AMP receptor protein